jgi:conjugal transfer pilus assembly protein TraK
MRKSNRLLLSLLSCVFISAPTQAATAPVSLSFPPNGQFQLPVSNTNPNLIVIPGDRIIGISSAMGKLTDKRNTRDGAVLFSSTSDKPFTLFIETEHGQVVSVQAIPRAGEGRSYRLLNAEPVARPAAKTWETSQPYESLLVELNKAILKDRMPEGYAPASTESDRLSAPAGLLATAEDAWTGNALRVVRYRVQNTFAYAVALKEQDFWRPGVRAVMFTPSTHSLQPGTSVTVYITRAQEVSDGQH